MELDRLERQRPMAEGHDDAIVAPRGNDELGRKGRRVDHERVVPRRLGRIGDAGEDARSIVPHQRRLAVPWLGRADHLRAERDRRALQAEADPERGDSPRRSLPHQVR